MIVFDLGHPVSEVCLKSGGVYVFEDGNILLYLGKKKGTRELVFYTVGYCQPVCACTERLVSLNMSPQDALGLCNKTCDVFVQEGIKSVQYLGKRCVYVGTYCCSMMLECKLSNIGLEGLVDYV